MISAVLIFISISSLIVQGLNQGVDFLGGRSYIVRFDNEVKSSDIESTLNNAFGSAEVKTFGASNQLKITTKYKVDEEGLEVDNAGLMLQLLGKKDMFYFVRRDWTELTFDDHNNYTSDQRNVIGFYNLPSTDVLKKIVGDYNFLTSN